MSHLYVESERVDLVETENRKVDPKTGVGRN